MSGSTSPNCLKVVVSVSFRNGITMPDWSTTAIFLASSLAISMINDGSIQRAAKRIGTRKVVIMNDFFFTRVRYSRLR